MMLPIELRLERATPDLVRLPIGLLALAAAVTHRPAPAALVELARLGFLFRLPAERTSRLLPLGARQEHHALSTVLLGQRFAHPPAPLRPLDPQESFR